MQLGIAYDIGSGTDQRPLRRQGQTDTQCQQTLYEEILTPEAPAPSEAHGFRGRSAGQGAKGCSNHCTIKGSGIQKARKQTLQFNQTSYDFSDVARYLLSMGSG